MSRAAGVLAVVAGEWRDLLAGSEGFLTRGPPGNRASAGRKIAWGEMDTFVGVLRASAGPGKTEESSSG